MSFRTALALLGLVLALVFFGAYVLVAQPFVVPVAIAAPAADADRLQAHVRALSEDFHPRSYDHPDNLRRAAAYIAAEFTRADGRTRRQTGTFGGREYENVIARFGPEDGPLLVIGAHYDAFGGPAAGPASPTPGADDNASGVAGLLEIARLLQLRPPPRPVELVAYTLEESPGFDSGTMGSAWHARSLRTSGKTVEVMISLEMIGYFSDAPGSQAYPLPWLDLLYPATGNFIAVVGRFSEWRETRRLKAAMRGASSLPVHSLNAFSAVPGIDLSDHRNYWQEGYSAVMVTDTAFNRNPHYHRAGDTFDRLDYRRMANVVEGVFAFTQRPVN